MNISMILSGGHGSRFQSKCPKQYNRLLGKEVIEYSVEALQASSKTDATLIVAAPAFSQQLHAAYHVPCVEGGTSRNASLQQGLMYIKEAYPDCQNVFIAEASRPFLTAELVDKYFEALDEYDAVITAQHITDSLGRIGEAATNREEYYLIQAPEAFRFPLLFDHFRADAPITATVQQLPPSCKILRYYGFRNNLKITYPEDLMVAEQFMKLRGGRYE